MEKYRIKYVWDMHGLANQFPQVAQFINQYLLEKMPLLPDGTEGELFDISDLSWSLEEAQELKAKLDAMNIPVEIQQDNVASLDNLMFLADELDKRGMFEKASEIDDVINKLAAEHQGKKVKLNDPVRNPAGSNKKFRVYVKDGDKVKKVQFGDPKMDIKRDDPERRKSFRARHKCDTEGAKDKTKAKYWSCYQWRKNKKVNN